MKAKIIGFLPNGDCEAITDKGEKISVDPFVGCSWKWEDREHLLNEWFEDENAHKYKDGTWLTSEHSFRILTNKQD